MRVVKWRTAWRVVDDIGRVLAICETEPEAHDYIARQPVT